MSLYLEDILQMLFLYILLPASGPRLLISFPVRASTSFSYLCDNSLFSFSCLTYPYLVPLSMKVTKYFAPPTVGLNGPHRSVCTNTSTSAVTPLVTASVDIFPFMQLRKNQTFYTFNFSFLPVTIPFTIISFIFFFFMCPIL